MSSFLTLMRIEGVKMEEKMEGREGKMVMEKERIWRLVGQ